MLRYIEVIPARESVRRGEALNLLGGVANDGGALRLEIAVWGRVDQAWEKLVAHDFDIAAGEHKHLYFTLPPECFAPERWGGEIEDIELCTDHKPPEETRRGKIVFID